MNPKLFSKKHAFCGITGCPEIFTSDWRPPQDDRVNGRCLLMRTVLTAASYS